MAQNNDWVTAERHQSPNIRFIEVRNWELGRESSPTPKSAIEVGFNRSQLLEPLTSDVTLISGRIAAEQS